MASDQAREDAERVATLVGQVLANRYQIEARLGEGAMGSVYRARHVKVGRSFAIKVLHPRLLEDPKQLRRFEREAELAGRLHHPNVIGVVDVGETPDGLRYMVMDFAEGPDLAALLAEAPMPPARIHALTRQMLEGLYHAHEAGLIHRDFKPENVIVEKDTHGEEVPRIVDFGIAILREAGSSSDGAGRLTTNGLVLGTPHYMAPEQAVADPIDHRIDLFALGIMIYEMLCGKLPFDGQGAEVARANLMLDPPSIARRVPYLEVDPLLEAFSRRLMAKRRDQRPATAKAARELLDLIKSDPAAAAALLEVPLAAAVRAPQQTEPVTPRPVGEHVGTFPPPVRDRGTPPQAPAMTEVVAVRADTPPRGMAAPGPVSTEDIAPIAKRRRGGYVAVVVAVIAIGIVILARGSDPSPPVVVRAPRPPEASPGVEVKPAPELLPATPVAPTPTPPPPAPRSTDAAKRPEIRKPPAKPPAVIAKSPPPAAPTAPTAAPTPLVIAATPSPAPPPPAVPSPAIYDANAFRSQWIGVGQELKALATAFGANAASDLQGRYSHILYVDANSSQAKRDAAKRELDDLHAAIAARKK